MCPICGAPGGTGRVAALGSAILDTAPDAIVVVDGAGRVAEWNPAAERILGYRRSEAIGRPIGDLIPAEAFRPARRAARGGGGPAIALTGRGIEVTAVRKGARRSRRRSPSTRPKSRGRGRGCSSPTSAT